MLPWRTRNVRPTIFNLLVCLCQPSASQKYENNHVLANFSLTQNVFLNDLQVNKK